MQGQKKLSFSALALSVWTAALAESLEPGVSLRGMLLYGVFGALLLTGISAVLYVCWQQTAVRQVWLFAAILGLLAEAFRTAMQAQSVCRQEFHSMALLGLAPAVALGGMPHSAFRLGCPGKGAVVVRAAGGGALSGRHCRPDGMVPSAGTGCSAAGPAAACTAVRGVSALAPSDRRTCAAPCSFSSVADFFGTGVSCRRHLPCVWRNGLSGAGIAACMERGHLLTYGCAPASDLAYLRCFPYRLPLRSGR